MIPLSQVVIKLKVTKLEKLYKQIRNNPQNIKFETLDKLLKRYGFQCRHPKGGSSHYSYLSPQATRYINYTTLQTRQSHICQKKQS